MHSKLASRWSSQLRCRGGKGLFDNGRAITSFTTTPRLHLCMSICRLLVLLWHSTYSLPASLPPRLSPLPLIPHVDTFISLSYLLFVSHSKKQIYSRFKVLQQNSFFNFVLKKDLCFRKKTFCRGPDKI